MKTGLDTLQMAMPRRMAGIIHSMMVRDGMARHEKKIDFVDKLLCDDRVPLTKNDAAVQCAADQAARECYRICVVFRTVLAIKIQIDLLCKAKGVPFPLGETDREIIARATDKAWWLRQLRKEFARRFEHASIVLGTTGGGVDPYISRESAMRQRKRNTANQKMLEGARVENEKGDVYTLADLAALGMSNKAIRRGELMTRIRGFEEIATALNHVGMFWTITCPSKFHSVGGTNSKYNGATPRQGQAYLCKIWSRMRAAMNRAGIRPYGFRIAEPHTDGCPHWHMLFFVDRKDQAEMTAIIRAHALSEDADEWASEDNRVKLIQIEAGKGTAAGYIAKYVAKNIDGHEVGQHRAHDTDPSGRAYWIDTDMLGKEELTPSQRVTYWSQTWGIRQFQQIGGAPVGVWRELRRVTAETVEGAPEVIRAAWAAAQAIKSENPDEAKQADFAAYVMAQGGPQTGRHTAIKIYSDVVTIDGRYARYEAAKPMGVYAVACADEIYASVRYAWARLPGDGVAVAVAVGGTRTGVNNCTGLPAWVRQGEAKNKNFSSPFVDELKKYRVGDADFDFDRYKNLYGGGRQ